MNRTINKILIANRGEIACRIIQTLKKIGIRAVAVYSDQDIHMKHVKMADESIRIGPADSASSYCNVEAIFEAAKKSNCDALHPGYGFLSENAELANKLEQYGITFIGPKSQTISLMGDKISAKKIAEQSGVSVIPGYIGNIQNEKHCLEIAKQIGYPVIIKAAAGGGGKGMRIVHSDAEISLAFKNASDEARKSFGNGNAFIERYIPKSRHIEIQILADQHGNIVCLGERECSIQRRYQKIIEEAPSPFVNKNMREELYSQSTQLAKKIQYYSAGTIEFAVDSSDGKFYFLEMNTRLQVEHPVSEMVIRAQGNKIDLVEQMIKISNGEKLAFVQEDIEIKGHAFESRIYSESPERNFAPDSGRIIEYQMPTNINGVRIDSGITKNDFISVFYDPMIAKLCTYGFDRNSAAKNMSLALANCCIFGIETNILFLESIFQHPNFIAGNIDTNFINDHYSKNFDSTKLEHDILKIFSFSALHLHIIEESQHYLSFSQDRASLSSLKGEWVVSHKKGSSMNIKVHSISKGYVKIYSQSEEITVKTSWIPGETITDVIVGNDTYKIRVLKQNVNSFYLSFAGHSTECSIYTKFAAELLKIMPKNAKAHNSNEVRSDITGIIINIAVKEGMKVEEGNALFTIEAMKMQNIICAKKHGVIEKIIAQENTNVKSGDIIIKYYDD